VTENKSSWILVNPRAILSQTYPSQNVTKIHRELLSAILPKTSNTPRQEQPPCHMHHPSRYLFYAATRFTVHYTTMLCAASRHMYN